MKADDTVLAPGASPMSSACIYFRPQQQQPQQQEAHVHLLCLLSSRLHGPAWYVQISCDWGTTLQERIGICAWCASILVLPGRAKESPPSRGDSLALPGSTKATLGSDRNYTMATLRRSSFGSADSALAAYSNIRRTAGRAVAHVLAKSRVQEPRPEGRSRRSSGPRGLLEPLAEPGGDNEPLIRAVMGHLTVLSYWALERDGGNYRIDSLVEEIGRAGVVGEYVCVGRGCAGDVLVGDVLKAAAGTKSLEGIGVVIFVIANTINDFLRSGLARAASSNALQQNCAFGIVQAA
eukprot:gene10122-biopygen2937